MGRRSLRPVDHAGNHLSYPSADVVVVGGGLIGCSIAHALARRGAEVALFERGETGREATWAAGGMLSPLGEKLSPEPFLELGLESLRLYPGYLDAVRSDSGSRVALIPSGKILLAFTPARRRQLEAHGRRLRGEGLSARWLDADELRTVEPGVGDRPLGGLHLEDEGQVENRALGRASAAAARRRGARIVENTPVRGIRSGDSEVGGVVLADGSVVHADTVVIAAGAWSGRLEGLPRPLPVHPVRGQMIALAGGGSAPDAILESDGAYLIPRPDGTVVVGSTMEEAGFDASTTSEAVEGLADAALRAYPALEGAEIRERWAGLRPGTPDGLPILGPDPEIGGLVYATGHFRNGILLAPVTALVVDELIAGEGDPSRNLSLFHPRRFADASLVQ